LKPSRSDWLSGRNASFIVGRSAAFVLDSISGSKAIVAPSFFFSVPAVMTLIESSVEVTTSFLSMLSRLKPTIAMCCGGASP
jgi:hypothetical protein